jgi:hypothetical protein
MLPEISMEPMRFARIEAKKSQMTISLHLKHCPFKFTKPLNFEMACWITVTEYVTGQLL